MRIRHDLAWSWSGQEGYDLHDALRYACSVLHPQSYLEIGVDGGGSLKTVLESSAVSRLVLCDRWDAGYCGHGFANHAHIWPLLTASVSSVRFLDGDSTVLLADWNEVFDLVTVDGGHQEQVAAIDLTNGWDLLRVGGILAFDDVGHADYPDLGNVLRHFLERRPEASLIPETLAPWRNTALLIKEAASA